MVSRKHKIQEGKLIKSKHFSTPKLIITIFWNEANNVSEYTKLT
jgi:hypothetical protein